MNESNTKYHLVVAKLRSYDVTIMDSYNRMDYLKIILKEVYQDSYLRIINDIKMCLGDLVEEKDISEFFKFMESWYMLLFQIFAREAFVYFSFADDFGINFS